MLVIYIYMLVIWELKVDRSNVVAFLMMIDLPINFPSSESCHTPLGNSSTSRYR